MSEKSVCQARASVMIYNNDIKKWEHAGGSQGISRVHVYHNTVNNNYRIVGRKVNDNEVVINCSILKNLKYNKATATFHQWRDQRQVYGLNFQSADDATSFSDTVAMAIKYMNLPPESHYAAPQYPGNSDEAPTPVPVQQNGSASDQSFQQFTQDPFQGRAPNDTARRSSHDQPAQVRPPQSQPSPPAPPQPPVQPPPVQPPPAPAAPPSPAIHTGPPAPPSGPPPVSSGPPPPPAGPPPPSGGPPAPPPPPPSGGGGGGAPPPPPPPPVGSKVGGAGGGGGNLSDDIARARLKKTSTSETQPKPVPASSGGGNMMAEMQKRLMDRQKKQNKMSDDSSSNSATPKPQEQVQSSSSPVSIKKNASFDSINKAKTAPPTENKTRTIGGGYGKFGKQESNNEENVSSDKLKALKEEILETIRKEINAAKEEIIEAFKQEISKVSNG